MDGVFLTHDTARNCIKVIDLPKRRIRIPYHCPTCNITHRVKAIHLYFDHQGSTVVSRKVMDQIAESSALPSDVAVGATIVKPPAARIDLNTGNRPSLTSMQLTREPINHKIVVHNVGI